MTKASLTSQSYHWCVAYRKNVKLDVNTFVSWLKNNCSEYAIIEHENDVTPSGVVEGVHYHLVFNTTKRHQTAWVLNQMRDLFGFNDSNGIEVDIYRGFEASMQYLTHQNEPLKTQHMASEIIHNLGDDLFNQVMTSEVRGGLTTDTLIGAVLTCKGQPLELLRIIGLDKFNHYFKVIEVIYFATYRVRLPK